MVEQSTVTWTLVLFLFLILIFFALGLWYESKSRITSANLDRNPYCIRQICSDGTPPADLFDLSPAADPNRLNYQILNYCLLNAPPCELIAALNSSATSSKIPTQEIEAIMKYYNNEYYDRCSYQLGGGVTVPTVDGQGDQVNGKNSVNGPNDDFLIALLTVASSSGLSGNADFQGLKRKCGALCTSI